MSPFSFGVRRKAMDAAASIHSYINKVVEILQQSVERKETLCGVKKVLGLMEDISLGVKQLSDQISQLNVSKVASATDVKKGLVGVCSPPKPRLEPVGLEIPLNELRKKLLMDELSASLNVISAPGGCGKTTLATTLCQDEQIKGTHFVYLFLFLFFGFFMIWRLVKKTLFFFM